MNSNHVYMIFLITILFSCQENKHEAVIVTAKTTSSATVAATTSVSPVVKQQTMQKNIGESCDDSDNFCNDKSYCDDTNHCAILKKIGEACDDAMCEQRAYCRNLPFPNAIEIAYIDKHGDFPISMINRSHAGICVAKVKIGLRCDFRTACEDTLTCTFTEITPHVSYKQMCLKGA